MRKVSICYTNYNRVESIVRSFATIHDAEVVDEIVISDDCSDIEKYRELEELCSVFPKVKLFRNDTNRDCYHNKMLAISRASNEWCCLWDSDNQFSSEYLIAIMEADWHRDLMLAPSFARPHFDYRQHAGVVYDRSNVSQYFDRPMFGTALNTANMFIHRDEFLRVWDGSVDPVTSDSIYFAYCWLNAGNRILILEGLQYDHPISHDSHYRANVHRTPPDFHRQIEDKIRALR